MVIPMKGVAYEALPWLSMQGITMDKRMAKCSEFELNAIECLEAYGITRGGHMCRKYVEDIKECMFGGISSTRVAMMNQQRAKNVITGKTEWKDRYGQKFPYHGMLGGHFTP